MRLHLLLSAALLLLASALPAQLLFSSNATLLASAEATELNELEGEDWSFYTDTENGIFYIDFEQIKFNLSEIIVTNKKGNVLLKDDVFDLPVNTIYEVDFSPFGKGDYVIELRSFTSFIRKKVSLK